MSLRRVWIPSPNYSSRGGATVRLIVLHTAEGARTIQSLGNFFASSSSGVSSHAGADDTPNTIGEYVKPEWKAWTQAGANPIAVSIELCAFAAWTLEEWNRHPNMLSNCAGWIGEEAARFGIPIRRLTAAQAQDGYSAGVCEHVDLGAWGGSHHDCGAAFPIDDVLRIASGTSPTIPEPEEEEAMAISAVQNKDGRLEVFVELESGLVKHTWQEKAGGGWVGAQAGVRTAEWHDLGNPTK